MCIRDSTSLAVGDLNGDGDDEVLMLRSVNDNNVVQLAIRNPSGTSMRDFEPANLGPVSYTHLRAHETVLDLVCRLLLEKKKKQQHTKPSSIKTQSRASRTNVTRSTAKV